ncbi:MAG: PEP-CTERM sorting domain-containing protein [Aquabacterium sp.]
MNKILSTLTLVLAAHGAHASLTVSAPSVLNFQGYDSTPASFTGTLSQGVTGTLMATQAGTISFTYLGKEVWNTTRFSFNGQNLSDNTREGATSLLGTTLSAKIGAGKVNFSFSDVTRGVTFGNGSLGAMMFASNVNTSRFGAFDFVVGFNDKGIVNDPRDSDFDDMVMGIKFTPAVTPAIPEPSTYALMALGLLGVAVAARRQRA